MVPAYHHYSIAHITLFVTLVLQAATSLRGASRVIATMSTFLQLPVTAPSWYAGRLWLLRVGYYKLTRPKAQATDWVWIVDHTVQLGVEKCFVILGLRLSALPPPGQCLRHEDVEPIVLAPVTKSNGEVVYQQLEAAVEQTGVPREIIADHGSDLQAGVERFCRAHPETCSIYDIKHKTALLLKHELAQEAGWQEFTRLATQTKQQIQQTALAFLMPPNQRAKARYMNVDILVRWGLQTLAFLQDPSQQTKAEVDPALLADKLGWLQDFQGSLQEWAALLRLIETAESFVRKQGLSRGCPRPLKTVLEPLARTERTQRGCRQLLAFVTEEASKAKLRERLLGSSEVIESVFGRLKRIEATQAKNGFTGLILCICAMVSTTTCEITQKALETVPTKSVLQWCRHQLGQSLQAKRKKAFHFGDKTEQKRGRLPLAA